MQVSDLIEFEAEVGRRFEAAQIRSPVHLSGGNETQLIEIFREVHPDDWVFSTWRSHYHALLHGMPKDELMAEIMAGNSMHLMSAKYKIITSSVVGGTLPIALGVAAALKRKESDRRVWCFVGDMAASIGMFNECRKYASGHSLPITFVIEDNGVSCDTPTAETWGSDGKLRTLQYEYKRQWPHMNTGKWVEFA